jgi:hypothetical protein
VPKNRRFGRARDVEKQLGLPNGVCVVVSSKTGEGKNELVKRLNEIAGKGS